MRKNDAIYGGEMSAHHYFKNFSYCDSGMIPWMLLLKNMKDLKLTLREMVEERQKLYPCSGEINFKVEDAKKIIENISQKYRPQSTKEDNTDGLSFEFGESWRFNLRSSNTEPLLRLNVESKNDHDLMVEKTAELEALIKA
jgi:phosphomannomutase